MRRFLILLCVMGLLLSPIAVSAQCEEIDQTEVLTLRRDLAQEKVLRLQSQLEVIKYQYQEIQKAIGDTQKQLNDLNSQLKSVSENDASK